MSYKLNLNLSVRDETEVLEEEEWKRRTTLPWLWKEIDQDAKDRSQVLLQSCTPGHDIEQRT
jgi:hypothetical protein